MRVAILAEVVALLRRAAWSSTQVFVGFVWIFLILFTTLSTAQTGNLLTGSREIKQGDKGFIAWRFEGYESVRLVGDTVSIIRGSRDMITIQPSKSAIYKITALGTGGTRLDTVWRVRVLTLAEADSIEKAEANTYRQPAPKEATITRGTVPESVPTIPPSVYAVAEASLQPSRLYAGIRRQKTQFVSSKEGELTKGELTKAELTKEAAYLKIVRIPDNSVEGASLHAVVLDKYGNFLPDFAQTKSLFRLSLLGTFDSAKAASQTGKPTNETNLSPSSLSAEAAFDLRVASLFDSPNLALTLCQDNAAYMKQFSGIDRVAQDFMRSLGGRVEQNRIIFDHRLETAATERTSENGGLTALYKASYKGVLTLKQSGRRHKALVILSGGKDDASLLYTIQDVMRSAKEFGVVIYTIAIGSNADTYALRMMAEYTGGRFYAVDSPNPTEIQNDVRKVLQEISLSYKAFYELILTAGTSVQAHCKVIDATLAFAAEANRTLSDTKPFAQDEKPYYSTHQIVATFAPNSFQPEEQYSPQLRSLAEALKDNPEKVIELVGHTDMQGNDGLNKGFALRRAQAVKSRLTALGANPAQIRLRSLGREKPVYYFESEEWQSRLNRRVELRWLDPSLVPYEILAEAVASEEEALRLEAEWTARGFDAYYDAFLINRIPAYRLKLWGFPTLESAEKTKSTLQQQYRIPLKVQ